jgi:DNA-binding CsgD family transcriptional regulator
VLNPTPTDLFLSAFWRKLAAAVAMPLALGGTVSGLADFFEAESARLLRDVDAASCELPPGSVRAFGRDTRQRWFLQLLDGLQADHGLCAVVRAKPGHVDALVVARKGETFGSEAMSWLELLAGQVHDVLELADSLGRPLPTIQVARQIVGLLPIPCLLADEAAQSLQRNPLFDTALEDLSGALRGGRVVYDDPFLQASWRQALLEASTSGETQSLIASAAGGDQWKVHIVPVSCLNSLSDVAARRLMFAFFEKSDGVAAHTRTLASSRPLTKAELEVLADLLQGQPAKAIARTRGASVNTVRSQIASILGKTGHRTQKALIASMSVPPIDAGEPAAP